MMNEWTFNILKVVIAVCSALITVYLIPYIKTLKEDKRYGQLVEMVEVAVRAAEQTFKKPGEGKQKKAEVLMFVSDWLNEQGIAISDDELDRLIECAVFQMHKEV